MILKSMSAVLVENECLRHLVYILLNLQALQVMYTDTSQAYMPSGFWFWLGLCLLNNSFAWQLYVLAQLCTLPDSRKCIFWLRAN